MAVPTPEADLLRQSIAAFKAVGASGPAAVQNGTIEPSIVIDGLEQIAANLQAAEEGYADPVAKAINWSGISNQLQALRSQLQAVINHGPAQWPQQASNIASSMWGLKSTLFWVVAVPPTSTGWADSVATEELFANGQRIRQIRAEADASQEALAANANVLASRVQEAAAAMERITGAERMASNAQSNAEGSAAATAEASLALGELLAQQQKAAEDLTVLAKFYQDKKVLVDETLEGASKVALAQAFEDRRSQLSKERTLWTIGFFVGAILLSVMGALIVPRLLNNPGVDGAPKYWDIVAHVLTLGPLVWVTWFAARKAGQTMRLVEDYAFKAAAALSFVGYRREMADDAEMLHQLRQYAIRNFGADPIRVLDKDEAASPAHDALAKVLSKLDQLKPEEAIKALSELVKNLGGKAS